MFLHAHTLADQNRQKENEKTMHHSDPPQLLLCQLLHGLRYQEHLDSHDPRHPCFAFDMASIFRTHRQPGDFPISSQVAVPSPLDPAPHRSPLPDNCDADPLVGEPAVMGA